MTRKPNAGDIRALENVEHVTEHSNGVYQYANTHRSFRAAVARRCAVAGWLESGQCVAVDGDGGLPNGNERWGIGYKLTDAGRAVLKKAHEGRDARQSTLNSLWDSRDKAIAERDEARAQIEQLKATIDTPETRNFLHAIQLEAAHQVKRYGSTSDNGKGPTDWFWLLGYLGGKAVWAAVHGDREKALHHVITSAAACLNWHRQLLGKTDGLRPGIDEAS